MPYPPWSERDSLTCDDAGQGGGGGALSGFLICGMGLASAYRVRAGARAHPRTWGGWRSAPTMPHPGAVSAVQSPANVDQGWGAGGALPIRPRICPGRRPHRTIKGVARVAHARFAKQTAGSRGRRVGDDDPCAARCPVAARPGPAWLSRHPSTHTVAISASPAGSRTCCCSCWSARSRCRTGMPLRRSERACRRVATEAGGAMAGARPESGGCGGGRSEDHADLRRRSTANARARGRPAPK